MNGTVKMFKRIAAALISAALIASAASCGDPKAVGNLGDVELLPGDIYAVISIMDYGDITAKLFPDVAPESVKRFTQFAERGYYDRKTIHRVIDNYMIQGGSLNGDGTDGEIPDVQYIPIETSNAAYNFYGALCFAGNSKGSYAQFYIVNNDTPPRIDAVIDKLTEQLADESISARLTPDDKKYYQDYLNKLKAIPTEVKEKYEDVGGLYQLDGETTVFGQVIDGFDVIEAISKCEVVAGNANDDKQGKFSKPINSIVIEKVQIINIAVEQPEESTTTKKPSKTTKAKQTDEVVALAPQPAATTEEAPKPAENVTNDSGEEPTEALPEESEAVQTDDEGIEEVNVEA